MGNLCSSNEPTLEAKLQEHLCRIIAEYESVDLTCGYIAIFEMSVAQAFVGPQPMNPNTNLTAPDLLAPAVNHSNSSSMLVTNNSSNTALNMSTNMNVSNFSNHQHFKNGKSHSHSHSSTHNHHSHNHSSTKSNLKIKGKEKKEITKLTELDYAQFIEWKIEQVRRANPDITDQELKDKHGLESNSSSNNILKNISNISGKKTQGNTSANLIKINSTNLNEEKEALLPNNGKESESKMDNAMGGNDLIGLSDGSTTNNIHDIKNILQNNDIKSSVQSLGDTTDKLLQILDRAKSIHKMRNYVSNKIIHIRGNKKTIFSYYLILDKYIIICYSEYSQSNDLEFKEWIRIQSKLEKLQITLKDMEQLLDKKKLKT